MARPRTKQHYVDNEKFLIVMGEYREKYLKSVDDWRRTQTYTTRLRR